LKWDLILWQNLTGPLRKKREDRALQTVNAAVEAGVCREKFPTEAKEKAEKMIQNIILEKSYF
jgi:hypothetical protein